MYSDFLEEIYDTMHDEIAREIDREIFIELLVAQGWFKQAINPVIPVTELRAWVDQNVNYEYKCMGHTWLFTHVNDFVAFTVRFA